MAVNYKEYSRIRSIARKRIERAAAAGQIPLIRIPTVAEIRKTDNPEAYFNAVQQFLSTPGSGLKWAKAENVPVQAPVIPSAPAVGKLSAEQKQERRRQQNRASKARQQIRKYYSGDDADIRLSYIKGLQTVIDKWRSVQPEMADWLSQLKPSQLRAFSDYMEYRFSQGDYTNKYVIDTFVRTFGELTQYNYDVSNIRDDFDAFLVKRKQLKKNQSKAEKYGMTATQANRLWAQFVKSKKPKKKKGVR